ncbi:MAG: UDP-N-acetylmuramoyl-tripeptide--D-alanyl-D-alanine ligase [Thioploca sp.]|nr:UDP-N-acetylmuramoyl-tripeptide--D-alanyl-D-alanine ligase [Thioploca sp.]
MIELTLTEIAPQLDAVILGHDIKLTGCSTDTRNLLPGSLYVALRGNRFDGHDFVIEAQQQGASAVMIERPVACALPTLRVNDTRTALGKLAQLWRQRFNLPMIAITGSNGKTSTKEMLKAILSQQGQVLATQGNLNNDIGVPLTLFNLGTEHRYAIIEMGANHPGEIAHLTQLAQPTIATITQCAPAHLEGFKNIQGVAMAKGEIFTQLQKGGTAIINNDDSYAQLWHKLAQYHIINSFALNNPASVTAQSVQLYPDSSQFTLYTPTGEINIHLPLPGQHNVMNALAASTCALACGCTLTTIQQGLQNMQPVAGRLQRYSGIKGITLINDTYNANPGSLAAALSILIQNPPPYWLILGDMNELGPHSAMFHRQAGQQARAAGVERLLAIGKMSRYAVASFGEGACHFTHHHQLIETLHNQVPLGATVLIKGSRGMRMETIVNALQECVQHVALA